MNIFTNRAISTTLRPECESALRERQRQRQEFDRTLMPRGQ